MEEVTCPRCGAVFAPDNTVGQCASCGYDARTLFARLRFVDKDLIAIALFLIFSVLVIHSVLFAGIALVQAWSVFSQKTKIGLHKPLTALNLEPQKSMSTALPISKPSIPNEWQALASLSRPRRVFMSSAAKGELALSAAIFLGVGGFFLDSFWNQFATMREHPQTGWFGLLWLALWIYFGIGSIRQWFFSWEILKDGELTTGVLTDWREGRGGLSVTYQFWTDSGRRFERQGKVLNKEELADEKAPLKVFYLPQDPTKSVALCCTSLRIRLG